MKFKKLISLTVLATLLSSSIIGCNNKSDKNSTNSDVYTVSMVTDVAGVNDHSFNQSAWEGLKKAEKDLGVKIDSN